MDGGRQSNDVNSVGQEAVGQEVDVLFVISEQHCTAVVAVARHRAHRCCHDVPSSLIQALSAA